MRGFRARKVVLRLNGIDENEFRPLPSFGAFRRAIGIGEREPVVLFLGRLIPRKGADLLIEEPYRTLGMTKSSWSSLDLKARPVMWPSFVKRQTASEWEAAFFSLGRYLGRRKKRRYVDATVFALPSRYENFGNTVAESDRV